MLGHDGLFIAPGLAWVGLPLPGLLAYVGLGPGQEFIPYFFALLGVVGAALAAALHAPVAALLRFLAKAVGRPDAQPVEADAAGKPPGTQGMDEAPDGRPAEGAG